MLVMERNGGLRIAGSHIGKPSVTVAFCRSRTEIIGQPIRKPAFEITAVAGILHRK